MPGPGHKQSRARIERAAAKAPPPHRSALADYLRNPTDRSKAALYKAGTAGDITTRDVAAALVAEIVDVTELLKAPAPEVAVKRPLLTNRTRALRALKEVVEAAPGSGGPLVVVKLVWPKEYAGEDPGDDVVTRAPPGFE